MCNKRAGNFVIQNNGLEIGRKIRFRYGGRYCLIPDTENLLRRLKKTE